jgi:YD repeat-containing protein
MSYDAFGRLVSTAHDYASGAASGNPQSITITDTWTNSYDVQGRLIQETSPTGFVRYEYDSLGRKTKTQSGTTVPVVLSEVAYTYDQVGRLKTVETVKRDGLPANSTSIPVANHSFESPSVGGNGNGKKGARQPFGSG